MDNSDGTSSQAQSPTLPADPGKKVPAGRGRGHWRTYDGEDGLADNWVWSILQDKEGYLWFGTENGVSRYDGRAFITFTKRDGLADNKVWSIIQDREGHLWFGTDGGASRYDGRAWTTFTTEDGLADNRVRSIYQDGEGHFWFGTDGGASRYDGQTWTTFTTEDGLARNRVSSITQDRDGILWFGTWDGGVSRYDGQTWTTFTTEDGLADNEVWSIVRDQDGDLWVGCGPYGSGSGGVSRYDGQTWSVFEGDESLIHSPVLSILQDWEGNLWFGTRSRGVSRYDGQTFTHFTTRDGLAGNLVRSIIQDREGHLWFGTGGSGVSKYDGLVLATYSLGDGLPHPEVRSICQDRENNLWFGTYGGGVSRYDSRAFITYTEEDGLAHNVVRCVLQDREGNLWIGTHGGGVNRYDGQTWSTFGRGDGLADDRIFAILQDRDGDLWVGTQGSGVNRYDGQTWTTFTIQDGLGHDDVRSIFQDREGRLWFGTFGGGASRYDGRTWTTFTTQDGLASNQVRPILQDPEGDLWFGTSGGVSRYDGRTWTTFTEKDGLAHNVVTSLWRDREGHFWFGTWGGVSHYDGQVFQRFTRQDGLPSNAVQSVFQDLDGRIWIGTNNGLVRFCAPAPYPPPVVVDAVVADRRYGGVEELTVPAIGGLTAFEFHGRSFKTRPEAMVYRYRLKGHDEDWKNTSARRVEYQDLPIGAYTFEVVAVDRDLVYSEKPATVRLSVVRDPRDEQIDELERRVRERTRELQEANSALSGANRELFRLNQELQASNTRLDRERAVERVRADVTAMTSANGLPGVIEDMLKELSEAGVDFDLCVINIVDEGAEVRRQYGATKQGWSGQVEMPLSEVSETFMAIYRGGKPAVREADDAVTAACLQTREQLGITEALERPTAVVDAPFAYGTLSLQTHHPGGFSEEDVTFVVEFGRVVALGYARFLDFQRLEEQNRKLDESNRALAAANQEIQEQTERKSAFLASMSHELRTPMNVIKGFTNLVLRRGAEQLSERHRDNLTKVTQASDHLLALINDLLDLSKIEAGRMDVNPAPFDVKALIAACCATVSPLLSEVPAVKLDYDVSDDVGEANTDQARVRQMVINLLSNAVKFTNSGSVTVRSRREDDQLALAVADTGKGIPADEIDTIFDEYRQVKGSDSEREGTGLGLSITRKFAELLGGSISVESRVGKGSTFTIRIPMVYREG